MKPVLCPMCGKEVTAKHTLTQCEDLAGYECRTLPSDKYWCRGEKAGDCVCLFKGKKIFFASVIKRDINDKTGGGFLLPIKKYL